MNIQKHIHRILGTMLILAFLFCSCSYNRTASTTLDELPVIFPDYSDIVIPPNMAPLNFMMDSVKEMKAVFHFAGKERFTVTGQDGIISIPSREWISLLNDAKGQEFQIHISIWNHQYPEGASYLPVEVMVAEDEMDRWIVYRLIEPGYQSWRQLGIYQRDITSFEEKAIVENHSDTQTCLNCHSFANHSPDKMMFHARGNNGGTYIYKGGKLSKVNIEQIGLKKGASYPIWHPDGKVIAFSSNTTRQTFFGHNEQPLEVYDERSDLIFYDTESGEVFSDPRFLTQESMETYPAWSPDGKWLYYTASEAHALPEKLHDMHYHLLRTAFNPETREFGQDIDTLYNARKNKGSVSYPRVSPDGNYLLYTWSSYGTFPIWHKEADLKMMDLKSREPMDISIWNSKEADSYHAWSSNGRWVIFGSRRLDGRYTGLYLAYWDKNGKAYKPFLLPQEDPRHYIWRLKSYNIPEFIHESAELPSSDFLSITK